MVENVKDIYGCNKLSNKRYIIVCILASTECLTWYMKFLVKLVVRWHLHDMLFQKKGQYAHKLENWILVLIKQSASSVNASNVSPNTWYLVSLHYLIIKCLMKLNCDLNLCYIVLHWINAEICLCYKVLFTFAY